jgi:uncharacterized membrane protein YgdD (TMEM256/DUF423 family)
VLVEQGRLFDALLADAAKGGEAAERAYNRPRVNAKTIDGLLLLAAAIAGAGGVLAGTFAAHGLEGRLEAGRLAVYETAVRYHMYHALAALAVAVVAGRLPSRWFTLGGWLFVGGVAIFSGSLYLLALSGAAWLGAITPIGGVAFVLGWLAVAAGAWRTWSRREA